MTYSHTTSKVEDETIPTNDNIEPLETRHGNPRSGQYHGQSATRNGQEIWDATAQYLLRACCPQIRPLIEMDEAK